MGGRGRGKERRHHFFLFDLAGLYKYDLQMKISPKKLSATQAKEFIPIIWKKIYTTCFRDLKIRKMFSNLFSI